MTQEDDDDIQDYKKPCRKVKPQKQETARAWWIGSSLKEYTDAVQELSDRLKKESEQGDKHDSRIL
jgi:hypothetical protein